MNRSLYLGARAGVTLLCTHPREQKHSVLLQRPRCAARRIRSGA